MHPEIKQFIEGLKKKNKQRQEVDPRQLSLFNKKETKLCAEKENQLKSQKVKNSLEGQHFPLGEINDLLASKGVE